MEKGVKVYPHSDSNSNSVKILDDAILILKRCLTLTTETTSGKCIEGTDKVEKKQAETEKVSCDFRLFEELVKFSYILVRFLFFFIYGLLLNS